MIVQWGYILNPSHYLSDAQLMISYSSASSYSVFTSVNSPVSDLCMESCAIIKTVNKIRIGGYNDGHREYPHTLFYFTIGY